MNTRSTLARSLSLVLPLTFAGNLPAADAAPRRPNIVVFVADDLGAMDVGFANPQTFYETPHLDAVARQGARFTHGYAANPVCSPTRYSLLTGKYPTRAGLTNWLPGVRQERFQGAELPHSMALEEVTIAEALRARGYRTAYVGKWHLGEKPEVWPEAQGFEVNIGGYSAGAPASFFPPYKNPRLTDGPPGEHLSARLAEESVKLIDRFHTEGKPFLLIHSDYAVHNPVQAPPELVEKYRVKAERLGLQDRIGDENQYQITTTAPRRKRLSQNHAAYAGLVEMMDRAAGRILAHLDELGIADNTLFIFISDNGGLSTNEKPEGTKQKATAMPTSNEPLRAGKGWLYEGGIRVPLLVRWPGVTKPGEVIDVPAISTDVAATVLAAAGATTGGELDGADLAPLLRGAAPELKSRALFWHYPHYSNQGGFPGGAVLEDGWKLLENYENGAISLYRLADDIGEQHDLAARESRRAEQLRAKLHAWYRTVDAKFLRAAPDGPAPWRP